MADRHEYKISAQQIWDYPVPDFFQVRYDDNYGIGLDEDSEGDRYTEGWFLTPIIDCGPNIIEYGTLSFDMDIFYGISSITWEARSSSDRVNWSSWYNSLDKTPVKQFVQFRFNLRLESGV